MAAKKTGSEIWEGSTCTPTPCIDNAFGSRDRDCTGGICFESQMRQSTSVVEVQEIIHTKVSSRNSQYGRQAHLCNNTNCIVGLIGKEWHCNYWFAMIQCLCQGKLSLELEGISMCSH